MKRLTLESPSNRQLLDASTDMVDGQEPLAHQWVIQGEGAGDNPRFVIGRQCHRMPFGQFSGEVLDVVTRTSVVTVHGIRN